MFEELPFLVQSVILEHGKDAVHEVLLGDVQHPDGTEQPAVVVAERHNGYEVTRRFALSTLVHLAVNVTEDEIWKIGDRETDYRGLATPNSVKEIAQQ